jgi:hypothetical protein
MKNVLSMSVSALMMVVASSADEEGGMRIVMQPGDKRQIVLEDKQSVAFEFHLPTPGNCSFTLSTESPDVITLGMGIMNALIKKGQPMVVRVTRDANNPVPTQKFRNATGRKTSAIDVELSPMSEAEIPRPSSENVVQVYRFNPVSFYENLNADDLLSTSHDIRVEEEKAGVLTLTEVAESASVVGITDMSLKRFRQMPDALGSTNIHVAVNKKLGYTTFAGLRFRNNCVANVWRDGTVEVDNLAVTADTGNGASYVSRRVSLNGKDAIVMAKRQDSGGSAPQPQEPLETASGDTGKRVAPSSGKLLPPFSEELRGANPVRVRNPNAFAVSTGLRLGKGGKDFDVPPNGVQTVYVPNGRYEIYFVYSDKPDALFQGDSFTLNNNGVEIQIVKVVNGNYGIRQVK